MKHKNKKQQEHHTKCCVSYSSVGLVTRRNTIVTVATIVVDSIENGKCTELNYGPQHQPYLERRSISWGFGEARSGLSSRAVPHKVE
jgi:hypothetical protein